jgi:elongation factor G
MDKTQQGRVAGPRCIAIVGPYLSGKTSLLEALLHRTGAISRQGTAVEKTMVGDASPAARKHGMSVEMNVATTTFMTDQYTFIDCPGSIEFAAEARASLPICDAAIVVCEADEKKLPALQLILQQLDELHVPRFLFINKIDRTGVSPIDVLKYLQPASSVPLVLRQLPISKDGIVTGFVDLALERAFIYQEHAESRVVDLPSDVAALEKAERFNLLERLSDHDDQMVEQLLADIEPPRDQVFSDLAAELAAGQITPVFFGSAAHGNGVGRLLKALRHEAPAYGDVVKRLGLAAGQASAIQVFKTVHTAHGGKLSLARILRGGLADGASVFGGQGHEIRISGMSRNVGSQATKLGKAEPGDVVALARLDGVGGQETLSTVKGSMTQLLSGAGLPPLIGVAVFVADRKDEVKLTAALHKLIEEDSSLQLHHDAETRDMVLWGQGDMHLKIALEKLAEKYGVEAKMRPRRIAYKETIRGTIQIRGRHKKQSGGHGQYGDVVVEISPLSRGSGFVFSDTITGGVVPKQYIPAVEAGVRDWMGNGILGFPTVDFQVNLSEGSYHDVDSSEMAFKQAARLAMVEGMPQCNPVLLEPIVAIHIHTPSDATARVNQIVTGHRGHLLGFDARDHWPGWDTVQAQLPEAEIDRLIIELRSATAGVGTFTFQFDHLAELVGRGAELVVAGRKADMAAAH